MVHWFLLTFRTICMSNLYELKSLDNKSKLHNKKLALSLLLILVSNDVQVNPGPPRLAQKDTFPCGYCEIHMEHPGLSLSRKRHIPESKITSPSSFHRIDISKSSIKSLRDRSNILIHLFCNFLPPPPIIHFSYISPRPPPPLY